MNGGGPVKNPSDNTLVGGVNKGISKDRQIAEPISQGKRNGTDLERFLDKYEGTMQNTEGLGVLAKSLRDIMEKRTEG